MSPPIIGGIAIACVLVLLIIKVPIAFSLGLVGLGGLIYLKGMSAGITGLGIYPFSYVGSWLLLAIPLFVMMGHFAFAAGVSEAAYYAAYQWLGRLPGGLAMATVAACAGFAAVSGSSVATVSIMGRTAMPEMKRYGYDMKLASGVIASGALLGILIPPSIILVLYGAITGLSVSKLLVSGIFPGILTALIYIVGIGLMVKRNPSMAPLAPQTNWVERFRCLPRTWGIILLFLCVGGGIYGGIFTPTEAAAVGAFIAFLMCLVRGKQAIASIRTGFWGTVNTTSMLFAIFIGASLFTYFLSMAGVSTWFAESVVDLPLPRMAILLLCLLIYLPLGMFLDTISILLITVPILFPVVQALGFDGIWFGILVVKLEEISLITPPVGMNVYALKGVVPEVPLGDMFRGIGMFLVMEFVTVAILIAFPQISVWLPNQMLG